MLLHPVPNRSENVSVRTPEEIVLQQVSDDTVRHKRWTICILVVQILHLLSDLLK